MHVFTTQDRQAHRQVQSEARYIARYSPIFLIANGCSLADLVSMNETFIRARTIFDRMMEESLARHTGG